VASVELIVASVELVRAKQPMNHMDPPKIITARIPSTVHVRPHKKKQS